MHFEHEEEILAAHGYPRLEEHRRIHDGLLRRAAELRAMPAGDSSGPTRIIEFLARDVVVRHMIGADRQYYSLFATAPD